MSLHFQHVLTDLDKIRYKSSAHNTVYHFLALWKTPQGNVYFCCGRILRHIYACTVNSPSSFIGYPETRSRTVRAVLGHELLRLLLVLKLSQPNVPTDQAARCLLTSLVHWTLQQFDTVPLNSSYTNKSFDIVSNDCCSHHTVSELSKTPHWTPKLHYNNTP